MAITKATRKRGGAKPRAQKGAWTAANRNRFLERLAETLNVRTAVQPLGLSVRGLYKLRHRDVAFAAAWDQTIADAYARVEMLLLERALMGEPGSVAGATGDTRHLEALSERGLLALLNQHRQTVRDVRAAADKSAGNSALTEELGARDRLMAKLAEIEARLTNDDDV